jgi:hypothetical protein
MIVAPYLLDFADIASGLSGDGALLTTAASIPGASASRSDSPLPTASCGSAPDGVDHAWQTKHYLGAPVPGATMATVNLAHVVTAVEFVVVDIVGLPNEKALFRRDELEPAVARLTLCPKTWSARRRNYCLILARKVDVPGSKCRSRSADFVFASRYSPPSLTLRGASKRCPQTDWRRNSEGEVSVMKFGSFSGDR